MICKSCGNKDHHNCITVARNHPSWCDCQHRPREIKITVEDLNKLLHD